MDERDIPLYQLIRISLKRSMDKRKHGCVVFIDLKKGFYTVSFDILLTKMKHHGIQSNVLAWFKYYLSDRKQYVYFNEKSSYNQCVLFFHLTPLWPVENILLFVFARHQNNF